MPYNQMDLEAEYWIGFKHGQETGYKDALADAVQRVEALNWIIPASHAGKWVVGYQTPGYPDQPPPNAGLLRTQTIAAIKGDQP